MKIRYKLIIVLLFVSLIPLSLLGISAVDISRREVIENIGVTQYRKAEGISKFIEWYFRNLFSGLGVATTTFDIEDLDPLELTGFLRLLFHQFPQILLVSFIDKNGKDMVEPVYLPLEEGSNLPDPFAERLISRGFIKELDERRLAGLSGNRGSYTGEVLYTGGTAGIPSLPVVISPFRKEKRDVEYLLYTIISLKDVGKYLTDLSISKGEIAAVLDQKGRVILSKALEKVKGDRSLEKIEDMISSIDYLKGVERGDTGGIVNFRSGGENWSGSYMRCENPSWTAVILRPSKAVFAAVAEIRKRTIFWLIACLLLAMVYGIYFSRTLSRPILQLSEGAQRIKEGDLEREIRVASRDEVGELARTFNEMAKEMKKRNDEILQWNLELTRRVEERTRELEDAQAELVAAQRMAAVAELGSSLAHEMNNPLTGIIGMSQLLLRRKDLPERVRKSLTIIEEEAIRSSDTVKKLISFSSGERGREYGRVETFDLFDLMEEVALLLKGKVEMRGISMVLEPCEGPLPIKGSRVEMEESFIQLFSALLNVTAVGGAISIHLSATEGAAIAGISVTSPEGDHPTPISSKDQRMAKNLGFWFTERIIRRWGGDWEVEESDGAIRKIVIKMRMPEDTPEENPE